MAAWTMPMYTAASPGNLLPKFSGPADGGTIARRASVLQTRTGVAEKDAPFDLPVAGAEPTNAVVPARITRRLKPNLAFIVPPLETRSPQPHEAARARRAGPPAQPRDSTTPRTRKSRSRPRGRGSTARRRRAPPHASFPR